MVTAHVLLDVERGRIHEAAEKLVGMDGVAAVYSVGGRCDLIAVLRAPDNEMLEELVTRRVRGTEGIVNSETFIGSRVYSRHDLEGMFAIGMEQAAPIPKHRTDRDRRAGL